MKKSFILLAIILCTIFSAKAQNKVNSLFFDGRVGFMNTITDEYSGHFTGDYLNFQMLGNITDNLSYRIRQRLNKNPFDENNILNGTDFLFISWQIDNNWFIDFGKQEILIGGFEYDYAPIDVYYYSQFCNSINQCYGIGLTGGYKFNDNNKVMLQVANSPFSNGNIDDKLSYNLIWFGQILDWWKTIWSINYADATNSIDMEYIALGNRFELSDFYLEFDWNAGKTTKDDFTFSYCGKLNYNYRDKLNIFAKGGYDESTSMIHGLPSMHSYAENFQYIGGGIEFFPLNNKDLRLHAVCYYEDSDEKGYKDHVNIALGASWKVDVIKK